MKGNVSRWLGRSATRWISVWSGLVVGVLIVGSVSGSSSQQDQEGLFVAPVWAAEEKSGEPTSICLPSLEARQKAQKMFDEVFRDRIAKASTTAEQIALIKEMLRLLREDPEPANRYILAVEARRLADKAKASELVKQADDVLSEFGARVYGPRYVPVSLIELTPLHATAWKNYANNSSLSPAIPPEWTWCREYVFAYAPSRLIYSVPPKAKLFTAVGYCVTFGGKVSFRVSVDNQKLYEGPPGRVTPIKVPLPENARALILEVDHLNDGITDVLDHSFWLYPRIHTKEEIPSFGGPLPPGSIKLTARRPVVSEVFTVEKSDNPGAKKWLKVVPPIDLEGPVACKECWYAHAPSRLVFPIPPQAKRFTAIPYCLNRDSVQFRIAVDGKEVWKSPNPASPGIENVDIPLPVGAKLIELIVDELGNTWYDQSCWCYPRFWQEDAHLEAKPQQNP